MRKKRSYIFAFGAAIILFCGIGIGVFGLGILGQETLSVETNQNAETLFQKANDLLKQTNYQEAIIEYEKVVVMLPESEIALDAQYWIGQSYLRMGKFDEALFIFEKLIKDFPKSTIAPVTQLMIARVRQAKENQKLKEKRDAVFDKKVIIDPKTGVKFSKIEVLSGKKDVAVYSKIQLSPNGKLLLHQNVVIPLKGEEPFDLVDTEAWRGIWSPDGKKVAFHSGDAICVVPVSPETGRPTGPVKRLIEGKYKFQFPVSWSPDSEKIVFMRLDEKIQGDIWTLSLKDGALNQIASEPEVEMNPSWSPDGKTIAYNWGDSEIRVVSAKGGKSKKIADITHGRYISWSPDGTWLFYRHTENQYLFRLADKHEFEIEPPKEVGAFFSWSSDGKNMLFYRTPYDFSNILKVVSTSGGPSFQLGRDLNLSPYTQFWSPDSRSLVMSGMTPGQDDWGYLMIPLAGTEAIPLKLDVSVKGKVHFLALSLDCERLLFSVEQGEGKESLNFIPVSLKEGQTTGPPVVVFSEWDESHRFDNWSWSSDGKKLAVIHKNEVWAMSVEKGKPVQLTKSLENEILPEWSPDGKKIVYVVALENGTKHLHVISASGGKTTRILDECGYWSHTWSPNSKEIVAQSKGKILAIPIDGGKIRTILDLLEHGLNGASGLCWLPDGKHLAFISENRIFSVPAKGGDVIKLTSDDNDWKDWIYPSPDGRWISYNAETYVKTRPQGTIWEVSVKALLRGKKEN